jgi:4-hydroxybenzoate polyprenyltransferase
MLNGARFVEIEQPYGIKDLNQTQIQHPISGTARIKLLLALSRTPHGLIDMTTPAMGALLWLGSFPPMPVIFLGCLTAFAGYTAVYALNDVVDFRVDRQKAASGAFQTAGKDLDAALVRHPMAQGLLTWRQAVLWASAWGLLAIAGAYRLNPVCVLIFLSGAFLEVIYCLLLKVSYLRTFFSGAVKTCGCIAAVFAVDPSPAPVFLMVLFLWIFFWEIGGQNIPNDWTDVTEDHRQGARTLPVTLGTGPASQLILGANLFAVILSVLTVAVSGLPLSWFMFLGTVTAGAVFLLIPSHRLFTTQNPQQAMQLFNRASYYPLAMLVIVLASLCR